MSDRPTDIGGGQSQAPDSGVRPQWQCKGSKFQTLQQSLFGNRPRESEGASDVLMVDHRIEKSDPTAEPIRGESRYEVALELVDEVGGRDLASILLLGILYIPAVLATAFVIGPSQTFALSKLGPENGPHGVTVIATSFQIAGCLGTSLATGIYGVATTRGLQNGDSAFTAQLTGFHGAVALVVLTSLIGIVLAVIAHRSTQANASTPAPSMTDTASDPVLVPQA